MKQFSNFAIGRYRLLQKQYKATLLIYFSPSLLSAILILFSASMVKADMFKTLISFQGRTGWFKNVRERGSHTHVGMKCIFILKANHAGTGSFLPKEIESAY